MSSTRAEQPPTIAKLLQPIQPTIDKYQPNLAGDFKFTGALNGSLSDPTIKGDLNAASVGLQKELLGSLSGQLLFSPSEIRFENAVLTANNGGIVKLNYAAPRAETATSGTLTASFERINFEDAIKAANVFGQRKFDCRRTLWRSPIDGASGGSARQRERQFTKWQNCRTDRRTGDRECDF